VSVRSRLVALCIVLGLAGCGSGNRVTRSEEARHYVKAGLKYYQSGLFDKALSSYDAALGLDPSCADAYNGRGDVREEKGEYGLAVTEYTRAIKADAGYFPGYYNRGRLFIKLELYREAIEDFSAALGLRPDSLEALYHRAIDDFNEFIAMHPDRAEGYNRRGVALARKNELEKAVRDFTRSMELNPYFVEAYRNRSWAYDKMGKKEEARADAQEAKRLEPRKPRTP